MGKWQNDLMLDAALDYIISNAATVVLCNAQPADFTAATTLIASGGNAIASYTLVGDGSEFTKADGVNGRKLTIAQLADLTINETATATHVAIVSGTTLLYVTTCVAQALTAANTVTVPTWDIELYDAA